jgi:hypothetical protein
VPRKQPHQKHEWFADDRLHALFSLQVPFLDGIDIATLAKVKQDNHDAFSAFSRSLIDSINSVKSATGTESFVRKIRSNQKNQIDAAMSEVDKTVRRFKRSGALRKHGILSGLLGPNAAAFIGAPESSLVTGLAVGMAAMVAERAAQLKEQGELSDKKGYFTSCGCSKGRSRHRGI